MNTQWKNRWAVAIIIFFVGFVVCRSWGFSLLGPFRPWMTITNGFYRSDEDEIGGPMSLTNEYRWDVPVVTYGFDQSFRRFFGTNGMAAVESAIAVFNNLPPASQMKITNYPVDATEYNSIAQSQHLIDLKSETMSLLLEHLGLAPPSIGVFCLKDFWFTNGAIAGDVVQRNYDPVTFLPSAVIGETSMTYQLQFSVQNGETNAWSVVFPVDPLTSNPSTVANGVPQAGAYFLGLTRDDVGGLKYLYSTNNINYETLPADVRAANGGTFVSGAWRPGVDKIKFELQPFDASSGSFVPVTNLFTDTYFTNAQVRHQLLERVTDQPDFLFSATNFMNNSFWYARTGTGEWLNKGAMNGNVSGAGPGVIVPPVKISFNRLGKSWSSFRGASDATANLEASSTQWGTYDGATNAPIVYPQPQTGTNQTTVRMTLMAKDVPVEYSWQVEGMADAAFEFQTSTDLRNWVTLFGFRNDESFCSYIDWSLGSIQRFYRIAPQSQ